MQHRINLLSWKMFFGINDSKRLPAVAGKPLVICALSESIIDGEAETDDDYVHICCIHVIFHRLPARVHSPTGTFL